MFLAIHLVCCLCLLHCGGKSIMAKTAREICLNALLHPEDDDIRRVSGFLFITDKERQKAEIIDYLSDYNNAHGCGVDAYIERLRNKHFRLYYQPTLRLFVHIK